MFRKSDKTSISLSNILESVAYQSLKLTERERKETAFVLTELNLHGLLNEYMLSLEFLEKIQTIGEIFRILEQHNLLTKENCRLFSEKLLSNEMNMRYLPGIAAAIKLANEKLILTNESVQDIFNTKYHPNLLVEGIIELNQAKVLNRYYKDFKNICFLRQGSQYALNIKAGLSTLNKLNLGNQYCSYLFEEYENAQEIGFCISSLDQAKLLTYTNIKKLEKIISMNRLYKFCHALGLLADNQMLSQEIFDKLILKKENGYDPYARLAYYVEQLKDLDLLSKENFLFLIECPCYFTYPHFIKGIDVLSNAAKLDDISRKNLILLITKLYDVARKRFFPECNISNFTQADFIFEKEKILLPLIDLPENTDKLINGIKKLKDGSMLDNFLNDLVKNPKHASEIADSLMRLQRVSLATPDVLEVIDKNPQYATQLANAIVFLYHVNLSKKEDITPLLNNPQYAEQLAKVYLFLNNNRILNNENKKIITQHPQHAESLAQTLSLFNSLGQYKDEELYKKSFELSIKYPQLLEIVKQKFDLKFKNLASEKLTYQHLEEFKKLLVCEINNMRFAVIAGTYEKCGRNSLVFQFFGTHKNSNNQLLNNHPLGDNNAFKHIFTFF